MLIFLTHTKKTPEKKKKKQKQFVSLQINVCIYIYIYRCFTYLSILIQINDIGMDEKTITTTTESGSTTYVPPRIRLYPLVIKSIMAGTIGAGGGGTGQGQGGQGFTDRGSGMNWEGETPTLEEIPSSEYTGGLKP